MKAARAKRTAAACRVMLSILQADRWTQDDINLLRAHLMTDLGETEREMLVAVLVNTFPPDLAEGVCQRAFLGAGYPKPALMEDSLSDARMWAGDANAKELAAYCMASFERMTPKRRADFLKWAEGKK